LLFVNVLDALDGTDDDAVWDDEKEENRLDAEERIDNEFETESEAKDDNSDEVNDQH